jgi:hypothetical protein
MPKDLRTLTTLEREKEIKKRRAAEEELIDQLGQDSETKAAPLVLEHVKEQNKKDELKRQNDLANLEKAAKNKKVYQRALVFVMQQFIREESIPKKYKLLLEINDKGIVCGIADTDYYSAFEVIGIPKYDLNACKVMAVRIGNTVAKMEGHFRQTKGGILVGTKEELAAGIKGLGRKHDRSR